MSWVVGDIPVESGQCFLLKENGDFLLQENYCRLVIHENDGASWVGGDDVEYLDPISADGCPVPNPVSYDWKAGDTPAPSSW